MIMLGSSDVHFIPLLQGSALGILYSGFLARSYESQSRFKCPFKGSGRRVVITTIGAIYCMGHQESIA